MQTLKEFIDSYEVERKFSEQYLIIDGKLKTLSLRHCLMTKEEYADYVLIDWTHQQHSIVLHVVSDYEKWRKS